MTRATDFFKATLLCALLLALSSPAVRAAGPADCTGISTDKGPVTGVDNKGVCEYKGIPFAAPPVGDLRFRLPVEHAPWTQPLDARAFGPECYQYPMVDIGGGDNPTGSEDCLYLNVWAPQAAAQAAKPVMVFVHGGGFQHGSGIMDTYHGARMAATGDVVVVTINYRLGPFGFFLHPALTEPDGSLEGNFGIYDQVAALKWVQKNIAAFGGDPGNVTVFGESAGGMSVGMLLLSPLTQGLLHKAVIESGPVFMINKTIQELLPLGETLAADVGCADPATAAACLRAADPELLLKKLPAGIAFLESPDAIRKFPSEPLIGGKLIPDNPFKMYREGRYNKNIPLMAGSNKDEASFFVLGKTLDTPEQFDAQIRSDVERVENVLGANVLPSVFVSLYPLANYRNPKKAYTDLLGDVAFTCPTRLLADSLASSGSPVFLYHFTYEPEGVEMLGDWGAFHGSELPFVFGNMTFLGIRFPSSNNKKVSKKVLTLWASFAHTGVPAAEDVPAWPLYDPASQPYMDLNMEMRIGNAFKKDRCDMFAQAAAAMFE